MVYLYHFYPDIINPKEMDITACMIQKYRDEDHYYWMVNAAIPAYPKPIQGHISDRAVFAEHTMDRPETVFLFSVQDAKTGHELYCDAVHNGKWTHHASFIAAKSHAIKPLHRTSWLCCWSR